MSGIRACYNCSSLFKASIDYSRVQLLLDAHSERYSVTSDRPVVLRSFLTGSRRGGGRGEGRRTGRSDRPSPLGLLGRPSGIPYEKHYPQVVVIPYRFCYDYVLRPEETACEMADAPSIIRNRRV